MGLHMAKPELVRELVKALDELLVLMNRGASFPQLSRAQGFVDGYMAALLSSKQATQKELLALVAEARARVNGPATAVRQDEDSFAFSRPTGTVAA